MSRRGSSGMHPFSLRRLFALATTWVAACVAIAGIVVVAVAQDYPAAGRSIRIVVPAAAGGALDMMGRVLAQQTTEVWKRQAYVENRPGANWIIGMDTVVRSEPDGYTLLVVSSAGLSVNPSVFPNIPFDPFRDLVPVASLTRGTFVLLANPNLPVNTASEFIAHLRANPGKLNHGSNSATTILLSALFRSLAKVDYVDVSYKGASQAINDTMAGVIQFCFTDYGSALPAIQGGKLKALAVASPTRYSLSPDIPALADDLPGFAMDGGMILLAPGKTPPDVVDKLNGFVRQALASDDIRQRVALMGQLPGEGSPEQIQKTLRSEAERWKALIKEQGIRFKQ
jgi:tripartite-type tricarboxylate transporter receptor subunit TctC